MECSFLPVGRLPYHLSDLSCRSIGNIDGGSDGQCEGCCGRGGCGARERTRRSVRLGEGRRVGGGEEGDRGRGFGVVRSPNKLSQIVRGSNQFNFQVRWSWTFLFLFSTQLKYEKNMRIVLLKVLFICLIPVGWGCSWRIARKVQTVRTFRGTGCPGGLGGRVHHICMKAANMSPIFSNSSPDSVLSKEFQFFRCLQSSRILGMSSESSTMLLVACCVGRLAGGFKRSWQFAKRAARGGCGSSMARGPFETFTPRISRTGRSSTLPMHWCCAVWERADDINAEWFLTSWVVVN